jgi:anthranilate synthase component 1
MYYPTLEQVEKLADQGNLVPVYREINADLETPVSAYLKVARPPYSFLLESVEGGERIARYSMIGTEPMGVIKTGPGQANGAVNPLVPVQKAMSCFKLAPAPYLQRFNGGMVGYLSYEAVNYFERLPSPSADTLGLPEAMFMLTTTFLVFDHLRHKIRVVSHAHVDGDVERAYAEATERIDELVSRLESPMRLPANTVGAGFKPAPTSGPRPQIASNMSRQQYREMVERVKKYIVAGDIIQAVVSQRLARPTTAHPFQIYRALRAINPSPYMYYLDLDGFQIVGASPEMLVQLENGVVATHPIAGTRRRGATPEEDLALEQELRTDEKERAEHVMLLDLGRNDIGRVSQPGTVQVTQTMDVERYSHVMHLVSHVTGRPKEGYTSYDALRACFPAGTVSGAPKIRAMEIIAELEPDKRGPYAGAVGYFDFSGNMDTAITIRTLVIKDGVAYAQAGGGIVFDSTPEAEYQETLHKASALMRAIDEAEARG